MHRFRLGTTAILCIAHHVGEHAGDLGVHRRYTVYPGEPAKPAGGTADIPVGGVIGADRQLGMGSQRQKLPIRIER